MDQMVCALPGQKNVHRSLIVQRALAGQKKVHQSLTVQKALAVFQCNTGHHGAKPWRSLTGAQGAQP